MAINKQLFTVLIVLCAVAASNAQFRLPPIDVELKVNQNLIPGSGGDHGSTNFEFFETTNFYGAAHLQLGQHFAVGAFYSKSFRGTAQYNKDSFIENKDGLLLIKGIDLRLSTGRAKNWRKYLSINYSRVEIVEDYDTFRLASKVGAYGASVGIMRKLGNRLYLNLIELGVTYLAEETFWAGSDRIILNAKTGLLYNISRRK